MPTQNGKIIALKCSVVLTLSGSFELIFFLNLDLQFSQFRFLPKPSLFQVVQISFVVVIFNKSEYQEKHLKCGKEQLVVSLSQGAGLESGGSCVSKVECYFTQGRKVGSPLWWCHWSRNLKEVRSEPHSCSEKGVLGKETAGWEALEWELAYEMREATVDKAGGGGQILEGHIGGFWAEWDDLFLFVFNVQFSDLQYIWQNLQPSPQATLEYFPHSSKKPCTHWQWLSAFAWRIDGRPDQGRQDLAGLGPRHHWGEAGWGEAHSETRDGRVVWQRCQQRGAACSW